MSASAKSVFPLVASVAANAYSFAATDAEETACAPVSNGYLLPPSDSVNSCPFGWHGSEKI
jgi:hypothetical protein